MRILFDMTNIRILHTANHFEELLFDESEFPPHLKNVYSFLIGAIDDPMFLGAGIWTELNLRKLYTWMKIEPQLGPAKIPLLDLRIRIRTAIAAGLRLEPSKLPTLDTVAATVSAPPVPKPSKVPAASRGSVGPLIHRVATEMWEAAGRPREVAVILTLRQTIMKALNDEHKIKTSTSSNELGRWQKQLLSSLV